MNRLEDRLRDAYRAAAETVEPGSIRPLADHIFTISETASHTSRGPGRWTRHLMIPMAAGAAVAAIAVLTTLIIPRLIAGARPRGGQTPATPAAKFAVALSGMPGVYSEGATALTIFNAISGATVATIRAPLHDLYFAGVATGDGRHFVAQLRRPGVCRTWLYRFRLSKAGLPGPLAAYPVRSVGDLLIAMAISEDGSTLAYAAGGCSLAAGNSPMHLGIMHLASRQARQWTLPARAKVLSLSLTAHGTVLAYDTRTGELARSAAYVLPTGAADGPAARHSRLAVASGSFGRSAAINSAVITPDGRQVYFTTSLLLAASGARWQLRAVELATGRTRVVGRYAGLPVFVSADPSAGRALVVDAFASSSRPAPVPSTSSIGSPVPSPSASELQTPNQSPTGSASVAAAPMPGGSRSATPTPSASKSKLATPTPSASGSQMPTPSPSPTGSATPFATRLELINLTTGRMRVIHPGIAWAPGGTIVVW
jgi:hypothetical protein